MKSKVVLEEQAVCPLCQSSGDFLYTGLQDRLFQAPGTYGFRACSGAQCGSLWLDPRPTRTSIGTVYESYYTHSGSEGRPFGSLKWSEKLYRVWDDVCARAYLEDEYGYDTLRAELKPLRRLLAPLARIRPAYCSDWDLVVRWQSPEDRGRLLDVGCGNGDVLQTLSQLGWTVEGTDVDSSSVAFARSRGLTVHHGDLSTLELKEASFDVVSMSHVIEHVHHPDQLVERARRLLKPGGKLVIVTPNVRGALFKKHRANWLHLDPPRHLILFSAPSLRHLVESFGFRNIEVRSSVRAFSYLEHASSQIGESGRSDWHSRPKSLVSRARTGLAERLVAFKKACGTAEGDELVLTATL